MDNNINKIFSEESPNQRRLRKIGNFICGALVICGLFLLFVGDLTVGNIVKIIFPIILIKSTTTRKIK